MKSHSHSIVLTILLVFITLLLFFSIQLGSMMLTLSDTLKSQKQETETMETIERLRHDLLESTDALSRYVETGNVQKLTDHTLLLGTEEEAVDKLKSHLEDNEDSRFLLFSIASTFRTYQDSCHAAYTKAMAGDEEAFRERDEARSIASYVRRYLDDLASLLIEGNVQQQKDAQRKLGRMTASLPFVLLLFVLSILLVIHLFTRWLKQPLESFARQAGRIAEGDLTTPLVIPHKEINVAKLESAFNMMREEIARKMDAEKKLADEKQKSLEYQEALAKARMAALQSQTNPHFLFNTLSTISRVLTLGRTNDAQLMVDRLSQLMRYNLTDGSEPATLGEELDVVASYLEIQGIRFSDRLAWSIEADDFLRETVLLPRFTLQPIVENCITHGLSDVTEGGRVLVRVTHKQSTVLIRVWDNGEGISKERMRSIHDGTTGRVGVENTARRLELFTGLPSPLTLASRKGHGTLVTIRLKEAEDV